MRPQPEWAPLVAGCSLDHSEGVGNGADQAPAAFEVNGIPDSIRQNIVTTGRCRRIRSGLARNV